MPHPTHSDLFQNAKRVCADAYSIDAYTLIQLFNAVRKGDRGPIDPKLAQYCITRNDSQVAQDVLQQSTDVLCEYYGVPWEKMRPFLGRYLRGRQQSTAPRSRGMEGCEFLFMQKTQTSRRDPRVKKGRTVLKTPLPVCTAQGVGLSERRRVLCDKKEIKDRGECCPIYHLRKAQLDQTPGPLQHDAP